MIRIAAALVVALLAAALPARSEIETVAIETPKGKAERWWPKVTPPKGWHHDRGHSLNHNLNAMAPAGEGFASAEAIIYARAIRKSTDASLVSLADFVARERKAFLARMPGYDIRDDKPLLTRDGVRLRTASFTPKTDGNWERVAYGEEDDYYLIFVVSARSKKALQEATQAWQAMAWSYRRGQ